MGEVASYHEEVLESQGQTQPGVCDRMPSDSLRFEVRLKPGETKRVSLTLDRRAFSYYDVNKKDWNAEPGDFAILIGSSSAKIELKGSFTLSR
jgi:Fibronectin type III-like domain